MGGSMAPLSLEEGVKNALFCIREIKFDGDL